MLKMSGKRNQGWCSGGGGRGSGWSCQVAMLAWRPAMSMPPSPLIPPPPRHHCAAGAAIASAPGVYQYGNTTLVLKDPPLWVRQLPAFQSAMAGVASTDEGPGLTPADAAAADAAYAAAAGQVGSAAGRGTVVAWVYGDNLADSGSPGDGNIMEHDSISFSARQGWGSVRVWCVRA